jgi:hypothetical protein
MLLQIGYAAGVKNHYYQHSGFIDHPTNFYPAANLDDKTGFPPIGQKSFY